MSNLQLNLRIWADHILSTIGCPQVLEKWIDNGTAVDQVKQVLLALYHLGVKEAREGACEMGLKCKVKTVIEVDYGDLEQFIQAETGHEYEIPDREECDNDTARSFDGIDGNAQGRIVGFAEDWAKFKTTGEGQYILRDILEGLCSEGKIQPGDYLVEISW